MEVSKIKPNLIMQDKRVTNAISAIFTCVLAILSTFIYRQIDATSENTNTIIKQTEIIKKIIEVTADVKEDIKGVKDDVNKSSNEINQLKIDISTLKVEVGILKENNKK